MTTFDRNMAHAQMLLQQHRYDLAQGPLRQALGEDPDNALACAWLAWCHMHADDHQPATDLARRAVTLDPEDPFFHFVLGSVYLNRDMHKEAMREAEESLRLDPADADHWRLLSAAHAATKRWPEALDAADRGLALDAEHDGCAHMRVVALRALGRKSEAADASRGTLERDPDSPIAHTNAGWTCLHRGDIRQAKSHFREALRLDPGLEWARQGMVEAIKATNPVYRVYLKYMLWMAARSGKVQWVVIIGGWLGYRFARGAAASNPQLQPFLIPLIVAYLAFVLLTWFAMPVFNLMLLVHPLGRHALDGDSKRWALAFGLTLAGSLSLLALYGASGWAAALLPGISTLFLIAPVAATGLCRPGRPRTIMLGYLVILVGMLLVINIAPYLLLPGVKTLVPFYMLGCVLSMLATNILNSTPSAPKA